MPSNFDIDFKQIVPRCGSQSEAFEELCCQLAHRTVPKDVSYVRLHGAGGDGGVECFADRPDDNREGWQAKYVFNINSLLRQATESLTTALEIHPYADAIRCLFSIRFNRPNRAAGSEWSREI